MNKSKSISMIFAALVIIGLIVWFNFWDKTEEEPKEEITEEKSVEELEQGEDTTTAINEDLDEIDISELDEEFSEIDKDLEQL